MDRKTKGRLAEAKIISYLTENGFEVYIPFSNNSKYDVIVFKEGTIKKLASNTHLQGNHLDLGL